MQAKAILFAALTGVTVAYAVVLFQALHRARAWAQFSMAHGVIGFVTNFFDTLGIGSFAPTTAIYKFRRMVPDQLIPGTLNAGHTLPVIFQAFIYLAAISIDVTTLTLLIASAVVGGWFGAGLVAGLRLRTIQLCMGGTLLVAAVAMLMRQFDLFPAGGEALELRGAKLAIGVVLNFLFAAISTLGVGFYAPCMTMVSLLGMNPVAAFPIMMGSGAFLMPVASTRFVRRGAYSPVAAAGLTLGGLAGVPLAAFVVKSLPLEGLRWLTILAVLYAAILMLRSATTSSEER